MVYGLSGFRLGWQIYSFQMFAMPKRLPRPPFQELTNSSGVVKVFLMHRQSRALSLQPPVASNTPTVVTRVTLHYVTSRMV